MIENIKAVSNPLTIIAIFAGLAEISGTGILPFISEPNQATYIWFLMVFPFVLIFLFFLTLNFNAKVLYSPSDYRDEENYMRIFEPSTTKQKILKMQEEAKDCEEVGGDDETDETDETNIDAQSEECKENKRNVYSSKDNVHDLIKSNSPMKYQLIEGLVIDKLSQEYKIQPQRDLSLKYSNNTFMFDAVFQNKNSLKIVEVKYLSEKSSVARLKNTILQISNSVREIEKKDFVNIECVLAIAHELSTHKLEIAKKNLERYSLGAGLKLDIKFFSLNKLLQEI